VWNRVTYQLLVLLSIRHYGAWNEVYLTRKLTCIEIYASTRDSLAGFTSSKNVFQNIRKNIQKIKRIFQTNI